MTRGIPDTIIEEIRQRSDLAELIGEYTRLERRGKNLVGLCPFHGEKTPSFTVSPDKQLYHCFGCGASGNVFGFVMQQENITFPEAARMLAGRSGVKIPDTGSKSPARESLKENLFMINELAARYYHYCLLNTVQGKQALQYLQKRGINLDTVEQFNVGYARPGWQDFLQFARKKGINPEQVVKSGLASPRKEKGFYDRFRDRIMFPIYNISGRVNGFGGRLWQEGEGNAPKYLNSPETAVFDKGSILYGLNLAREAIRAEKKAIVVEGYTDVITAHQAGVKNVVASLGTALTKTQARSLRSQAETVVTAYDADSAGEEATWRGLGILQSSGCLVRVAEFPDGQDPDGYISEHGPGSFKAIIEEALPLIEYRLLRLKQKHDLSSDRGRLNYTGELLDILFTVSNNVEQDYYLKKSAEELGVEEEALRGELKKRQQGKRSYKINKKGQIEEKTGLFAGPAEKILISLMLQSKEIAEQGRNSLKPDFFDNVRVKNLIEVVMKHALSEDAGNTGSLLDRYEGSEEASLITEAVTDPSLQELSLPTAKRMAGDCIEQLYRIWARKRQFALQKKMKEMEKSGSSEEVEELLREYQVLLKKKEGGIYCPEEGGDFNG